MIFFKFFIMGGIIDFFKESIMGYNIKMDGFLCLAEF